MCLHRAWTQWQCTFKNTWTYLFVVILTQQFIPLYLVSKNIYNSNSNNKTYVLATLNKLCIQTENNHTVSKCFNINYIVLVLSSDCAQVFISSLLHIATKLKSLQIYQERMTAYMGVYFIIKTPIVKLCLLWSIIRCKVHVALRPFMA